MLRIRSRACVGAWGRRCSGLLSCSCTQVDEGSSLAEVQALLDAPLQQNSQLVTGQLDNGLCYVILPNAVPPERFEAHLEIHAGAPRGRGAPQL